MSKKKILIAEDEENLRLLYQDLLESEGFFVDSVENGMLALEALQKKKYDVILLDIRMPEKDGLTVSKEIRKNAHHYHSPKIVFLTNLSQNETISEALQSQVAGYLIKGKLTPDEFIEEVKTFL